MLQPTASAAPSTAAPSAPAGPVVGNVTRSDAVVGSVAPAAATQTGTVQPSGAPVAVPQQPQGGGSMMLIMMLPIAALMIFMFLGNRKETKKRAALMAGLQRNDKVQTAGGMIGNIAEINDTEVVLRVDEVTNTRVRVSRSAITAVLNHSAKTDGIKAIA